MRFLKSFLIKSLTLFYYPFILYSRVLASFVPGLTAIWYDRLSSKIFMRNGGFNKLFPGAGSKWLEALGEGINSKKMNILHSLNGRNISLSFYTPNYISRYRAETFSTKEPETLDWIDTYAPEGGVFFDIGANVGLYSIYHAKTKNGLTYAFEPSVFNLKLLVKNVNLNQCQDKIKIVTNPLTSANAFADFNLQNTQEGGALSSFGVDYGQDGKKLDIQIAYSVLGFSLDFLVENKLIVDVPSSIKIDVDGIENLILRGATKVLSNPICRSVLIEVDDSFKEMASEVGQILTEAGFTFLEKKSAEKPLSGQNITFNQIWVK
jgi:FkbM family methyltransferase